MPGAHSIERFLVEEELRWIMEQEKRSRKKWCVCFEGVYANRVVFRIFSIFLSVFENDFIVRIWLFISVVFQNLFSTESAKKIDRCFHLSVLLSSL